MKLPSLLALFLSVTSSSAFVVHGRRSTAATPTQSAPRALLSAMPKDEQCNNEIESLSHAATVAAATFVATLASSPLVSLAEDDDYVYGAVNAPGGIGLAVGLGVLAILTAAVPVILAPGEDAFNEMKDRDEKKWGK
ncbi:hypothetical protein ACHAXA_010337 [Cyclostephanos tholiformis]|uniref:Uncharacterized protein n=1 Tax=Cyclostephanos tholiformis TaxID=382380 RepID=A0ABD3RSV0_9STRA